MKQHFWIPILGGGLGGAINAFLCYAKIPVKLMYFEWHILPAGAAHGALLAFVAIGLAKMFYGRPRFLKGVGLFLAGILGGWMSLIPLGMSISEHSFREAFGMAFEDGLSLDDIAGFFHSFGLVSFCYYFFLNILKFLEDRRSHVQIAIGMASGILGSLWFWMTVDGIQYGYLSFFHGAIWGLAVGFGMWLAQAGDRAAD